MIADLNSKGDYNNKPYDVHKNGVAIYTLSDKGENDYVSNNHFTHHYLNKYPKEILGMLDKYAEEKAEINNASNPYVVKEKKQPEPSNAKPILFKKSQKEESNEPNTQDYNNQFNIKNASQAKKQQQQQKNEVVNNNNNTKKPSNTFKIFNQHIMNCVNRPGNELYKTELFKKEMDKYGKQTGNRFNTKISSSK